MAVDVTTLFAEHFGPVVAYARRRGATWDEAHDVAAEVFAIAWRRRDQVPTDAARPWLLAVARRVLANQRRGQRRRSALVGRLAGQPRAAPAPVVEDDDVAAALAGLRAADREVLRLVAWDGLTQREAALVLGISESGVANRLSRARERLRRALSALESLDTGGA